MINKMYNSQTKTGAATLFINMERTKPNTMMARMKR
jgi:hypothetical protein